MQRDITGDAICFFGYNIPLHEIISKIFWKSALIATSLEWTYMDKFNRFTRIYSNFSSLTCYGCYSPLLVLLQKLQQFEVVSKFKSKKQLYQVDVCK